MTERTTLSREEQWLAYAAIAVLTGAIGSVVWAMSAG